MGGLYFASIRIMATLRLRFDQKFAKNLSRTTLLFAVAGLFYYSTYTLMNLTPKNTQNLTRYWAQTRLDEELLSPIFATPTCQQNQTHLRACLAAIDNLLSHHAPPLTLMPPNVKPGETAAFQFGPLLVHRRPITPESDNSDKSFLQSGPAKTEVESPKIPTTTEEDKIASMNGLAETLIRDPQLPEALGHLGVWLKDTIFQSNARQKARWIAESYNVYLSQRFDPFTYILPTRLVEALNDGKLNTHQGFGLEFLVQEQALWVREIYPNGPAQRAGMQVGDQILQIGPFTNLSESYEIRRAHEYVERATRSFKVTEFRFANSTGEFHKSIEPARFAIPNVYGREVQEGVAYIRVRSFYPKDTCRDFNRVVKNLPRRANPQQKGSARLTGIILDLRGNVGGFIEQGNCLLEYFLPKPTLLSQVHFLNEQQSYSMQKFFSKSLTASRLPLAVIVDSQTASTAELTAGTLQFYGRAKIVGEKSYGKGSIQSSLPWDYRPQSVTLFKTVGSFFLPNGKSPHVHGITPDLVVENIAEGPRLASLYPHLKPFPDLPGIESARRRKNLNPQLPEPCDTLDPLIRHKAGTDPALNMALIAASCRN